MLRNSAGLLTPDGSSPCRGAPDPVAHLAALPFTLRAAADHVAPSHGSQWGGVSGRGGGVARASAERKPPQI